MPSLSDPVHREEAAGRRGDLTVIASQGKTGLKPYFIGSVTEKAMKETKCPVLLIRNPDFQEASPPSFQ